jgi:hypothetical protein
MLPLGLGDVVISDCGAHNFTLLPSAVFLGGSLQFGLLAPMGIVIAANKIAGCLLVPNMI